MNIANSLKKTALFSQYIIISPSLWWDNESLLQLKPQISPQTKIYIGVGKEGKIMEGGAKRLFALLKKLPLPTEQVRFGYFSDKNHATIFHQAVYKAFESLHLQPSKK